MKFPQYRLRRLRKTIYLKIIEKPPRPITSSFPFSSVLEKVETTYFLHARHFQFSIDLLVNR